MDQKEGEGWRTGGNEWVVNERDQELELHQNRPFIRGGAVGELVGRSSRDSSEVIRRPAVREACQTLGGAASRNKARVIHATRTRSGGKNQRGGPTRRERQGNANSAVDLPRYAGELIIVSILFIQLRRGADTYIHACMHGVTWRIHILRWYLKQIHGGPLRP